MHALYHERLFVGWFGCRLHLGMRLILWMQLYVRHYACVILCGMRVIIFWRSWKSLEQRYIVRFLNNQYHKNVFILPYFFSF
jgi:hypothetical protein